MDEDAPSALDYPQTHKHEQAVEGLRDSLAVVVGMAGRGRSYLSSDKTVVYTETPFTVEDVLRDKSGRLLTSGSTIIAARAGGVLRLPSGRVILRGCIEESMPHPFHRYLLLLDYSKTADMFPIRTGFELDRDHVYMLDLVERGAAHRQNSQEGQLDVVMLGEYGLTANDFLEIVRKLLEPAPN